MTTNHTTQVIVKTTKSGKTTYTYFVDGNKVRTSNRFYKFSNITGEFFSSRYDLMLKNTNYNIELRGLEYLETLTLEGLIKKHKESAIRFNKRLKELENKQNVAESFYYGYNPEERIANWKEEIEYYKNLINYETELTYEDNAKQELARKKADLNIRRQRLEIVEYTLD